jgi:hypothetical protein
MTPGEAVAMDQYRKRRRTTIMQFGPPSPFAEPVCRGFYINRAAGRNRNHSRSYVDIDAGAGQSETTGKNRYLSVESAPMVLDF